MSVTYHSTTLVQTEMSQQLLDGLLLNFIETLMDDIYIDDPVSVTRAPP